MNSLLFGASGSSTANNTYWEINPPNNATSQTTVSFRQQPVPAPIQVSNFFVSLLSAPGTGNSITLTVLKNGVATALAVTIADTNKTGSDTSDTVAFAAGDLIAVKCTTTGTPTNSRPSWNLKCTSTAGDYFPVFGGMVGSVATGTTYAYPFAPSNNASVTTEAQVQLPIPCAGTISNLYSVVDTAPGAGNSIAFTPVKNGVATSVSCTIANTATSASDTTNTFSVSAGDTLSIQLVKTGTPASARQLWGYQFTPAIVGQSFFGLGSPNLPSTTATNFEQPLGIGFAGWSTVEASGNCIPGTCTLQALYFKAGTAPGGSASWAMTVRQNSANTALTATISGSPTTANLTGQNVVLAQTDVVDLQMVPANSPASMTNGAHIGVLVYIAPPNPADLGSNLPLLGVG